MIRTRPRCVLIASTLAGCALPNGLPSFQVTRAASRAPAPAPEATALLPAPLTAHHAAVAHSYDATTDQTRISLTTHHGTHFLWIEHPRVTFFYVYSGTAQQHAPSSVFLVFRTIDPQGPKNNRLALVCGDQEQPQTTIPEFRFESGAFVSHRVYTYQLTLATFAEFIRCSQASLRVGDIRGHFSAHQLDALRSLGTQMRGLASHS